MEPRRATGLLTTLSGTGFGPVPARPLAAQFDRFARDAVCAAFRPATSGRARLVILETAATTQRYGTCTLQDLRAEFSRWARLLASGQGESARVGLETRLLSGLLEPSGMQVVYRLAPRIVPFSRPIVLIDERVLSLHGRLGVLHALWQTEMAAMAAASAGGAAAAASAAAAGSGAGKTLEQEPMREGSAEEAQERLDQLRLMGEGRMRS